jgi:hypothetical protein
MSLSPSLQEEHRSLERLISAIGNGLGCHFYDNVGLQALLVNLVAVGRKPAGRGNVDRRAVA